MHPSLSWRRRPPLSHALKSALTGFVVLSVLSSGCLPRRFNSEESAAKQEGVMEVESNKDAHFLLAMPVFQHSVYSKPQKGYFCFYHAQLPTPFRARDKVTEAQLGAQLKKAFEQKKIKAIMPGTNLLSVLSFWRKKDHLAVSIEYIKQRLQILEQEARARFENQTALAEHARLSKQLTAKLGAMEASFDVSTTSDAQILLGARLNGAFETWDDTLVKLSVDSTKIVENAQKNEAEAAEGAKESVEIMVEREEVFGAPKDEGEKLAMTKHEFKVLKQAIERAENEVENKNMECPGYKDFYNLRLFSR
jgi:hypothetical protein